MTYHHPQQHIELHVPKPVPFFPPVNTLNSTPTRTPTPTSYTSLNAHHDITPTASAAPAPAAFPAMIAPPPHSFPTPSELLAHIAYADANPASDKRRLKRRRATHQAIARGLAYMPTDPDSLSSHDKKRLYLDCLEQYVVYLHNQLRLARIHPLQIERVSSGRGLTSRSIRTLLVHLQENASNFHEQRKQRELQCEQLHQTYLARLADIQLDGQSHSAQMDAKNESQHRPLYLDNYVPEHPQQLGFLRDVAPSYNPAMTAVGPYDDFSAPNHHISEVDYATPGDYSMDILARRHSIAYPPSAYPSVYIDDANANLSVQAPMHDSSAPFPTSTESGANSGSQWQWQQESTASANANANSIGYHAAAAATYQQGSMPVEHVSHPSSSSTNYYGAHAVASYDYSSGGDDNLNSSAAQAQAQAQVQVQVSATVQPVFGGGCGNDTGSMGMPVGEITEGLQPGYHFP